VYCPESATDVGSQLPVAVRPVVGPRLRPGSVRKVQRGWAAPRALMPGIQIAVSPALMGSSHLVQVVSVAGYLPFRSLPSSPMFWAGFFRGRGRRRVWALPTRARTSSTPAKRSWSVPTTARAGARRRSGPAQSWPPWTAGGCCAPTSNATPAARSSPCGPSPPSTSALRVPKTSSALVTGDSIITKRSCPGQPFNAHRIADGDWGDDAGPCYFDWPTSA
jgi:hypothetical protein